MLFCVCQFFACALQFFDAECLALGAGNAIGQCLLVRLRFGFVPEHCLIKFLFCAFFRLHSKCQRISAILNAASGERTEGRLYVDTLSVQGVGLDGYIYDRVPRKDSVQLVLNNQADVSEFVLTFEDTLRQLVVADTLSVYYRRTESYLSFECGCLYTFTLDTALTRSTRHFIDSIVINSIEVNTANVENIKIYHTP